MISSYETAALIPIHMMMRAMIERMIWANISRAPARPHFTAHQALAAAELAEFQTKPEIIEPNSKVIV